MATNAQLIAPFGPVSPVADVGLDAAHVLESGEIYFSVQTNFYSQTLGRTIRRGDLLSSYGVIVRSNESLVARFTPSDPTQHYGLQSVYVWPSGEVWFTTEVGLNSTNSVSFGAGDLVSDQGYIVYRNLDLLAAFAPLEDLNNFGLDALFIITDVTSPPPAPRCVAVAAPAGTTDLRLQFKGQGKVFQLLKAPDFFNPWLPITPIGLDLEFTDSGALQDRALGFYRLQAW